MRILWPIRPAPICHKSVTLTLFSAIRDDRQITPLPAGFCQAGLAASIISFTDLLEAYVSRANGAGRRRAILRKGLNRIGDRRWAEPHI